MWNIVEFDDNTVQIVPNCWISSDKKNCYWPPDGLFKSNKIFLREVKKCVSPSINWSLYNISLVLGKYDNFEKGLKKLKKAEDHTDLTTDVEKEKKSRKNRKKKNYSSSSSDELHFSNSTKINIKPLPEPPTATNMTLSKPSTSKFHATHQATTPSLAYKPKACSTLFDLSEEESISSNGSLSSYEPDNLTDKKLENSKNIFNNVNNEHESGSDAVNYTPTVKLKRAFEYSTCENKKMENMKRIKKAGSLSDADFKNLVLRQLAVIKVNVRKLDDRVKNLSFSNSVVLTSSVEDIHFNDVIGEFPMNTEEALKKVESSLMDITYKLNLTTALTRLGGTKTDEATKFILRKLFTDKLAMTYSWCGGKGKRVMSSLAVSRVIIDSVFKIVKTTTETEIIGSIKNWLRHAKTRNENCEKRCAEDSTEQISLP